MKTDKTIDKIYQHLDNIQKKINEDCNISIINDELSQVEFLLFDISTMMDSDNHMSIDSDVFDSFSQSRLYDDEEIFDDLY